MINIEEDGFKRKSKASPSLALGKSSAFLFLAHPLQGEDFRAIDLMINDEQQVRKLVLSPSLARQACYFEEAYQSL
jgi:hypothetical protein